MPTYLYQCSTCGKRSEVFRKIADIDLPVTCSVEGAPCERRLQAPVVRGDYAGYSCPVTGSWIEGRKAHTENLKRQGCRVFEPGEVQALQRRKVREEAELDLSVENTVGKLLSEMPSDKLEKLAAEAAVSEVTFERV